MNDFGKINPKLPFFILETLEKDSITFQMKPNTIFNLVYENLRNTFQNLKVDVDGKYDKKKSFTLKKEFYREYIDVAQYEVNREHNISEADYFRNLLYQYCKLPVFEREKVLFKQNYKILKDAIRRRHRIRMYLKDSINDGPREIEPYFMEHSEEFHYLFGYCYIRKEYRVFRLSHIEKITILDAEFEYFDENKVIEYKENFDPFLSYGKRVVVRFAEQGKIKYKTIISNRPKLLREEGDIYTFECSEKKAQVFFSQFFTSVEILEPKSLREWYKGKLEEALRYYG
jgi:predicted DNA-binding transcriptional regulator YafY